VLPIAGNACEHITAVFVAAKNKMDLSLGVAIGSSVQVRGESGPGPRIWGWFAWSVHMVEVFGQSLSGNNPRLRVIGLSNPGAKCCVKLVGPTPCRGNTPEAPAGAHKSARAVHNAGSSGVLSAGRSCAAVSDALCPFASLTTA
jgi:hypothetical protein